MHPPAPSATAAFPAGVLFLFAVDFSF